MNFSMPRSFFAIAVLSGVLLSAQWTWAGNLPVWGGGTTTTQPQIQEPSKPIGSEPTTAPAQTVQPSQPGIWTAPSTTSSPTVTTPIQQPRTFQLQPSVAPRTGLPSKEPSTRPLISATPVQETATQYGPVGHGEIQGYDSSSDPPDYSFAMKAIPNHLVYGVNQQGEVTGESGVEISLKSVPATTMDQNCDPWMTKLEFFSQTHHERLPNGAPVSGEFHWDLFNTLELPLNQSCYFDIKIPFQKTFFNNFIAQFCDPDQQSSGKPTEVVVLAKATQNTVILITTTMEYGRPVSLYDENGKYIGAGPPPTDSVSRKINAAQVTMPISFICENTP